MSPQTPLTPPLHPLLAGGYSKATSLDSLLLSSFQWVFCVFTCNHPPQQTLHPVAPLLPSSQAFREEGQTNRYTRNIRLYRDISFDMHRSPCRQERSESRVGGAGRAIARTEGVIPSSSGLFASYALQHTPQQTLHPVASRHPSSQTFQEEGAFYRYTRWKL